MIKDLSEAVLVIKVSYYFHLLFFIVIELQNKIIQIKRTKYAMTLLRLLEGKYMPTRVLYVIAF